MSITARDLINSSDKAPFMQWKAKAKEVLGDSIPSTKDEILGELQLLADMEPEPKPEAAPAKAVDGGVEVNLVRNYVPRYVMGDDGKFVDQRSVDGSQNHERISAGIAILHVSDAEKVLSDGRALPTANTHRQIAKTMV